MRGILCEFMILLYVYVCTLFCMFSRVSRLSCLWDGGLFEVIEMSGGLECVLWCGRVLWVLSEIWLGLD